MAIFGITMAKVRTAAGVVEQADRVANRAYALLTALEGVIVEGPKLLLALKNAVQSAISFVGNAISALRNNPAARGPWRIVFLLMAGVLRGVEVLLEGLKAAIELLRDALTSKTAKALRKAIDALEEKLLQYAAASIVAKELLGYLMGLCEFLEEQQPTLEAADRSLRPLVESTHLEDITDALKEVERVLTDVNAQIDAIEAKVDALKALQASVNAVTTMVAGVFDAINSVLGFFRNLFERIKDLISSIPFIGYLQDKLSEFIDWALDKLGVRAALQRAGEAFRDLPFIKAVFDFMDQLKQLLAEIIASVEASVAKVADQIKASETLGGFVATLIELFSRLDVKKLQEWLMPEWIQEIIERIKGIQERLEDPPPPETPEQVRLAAEIDAVLLDVRRVTIAHSLIGGLPFHRDREPELAEAFARVAGSALPAQAVGMAPAQYGQQLGAVRSQLQGIREQYQQMFAEQSQLGAAYFLSGYQMLVEGPGTLEALRAHERLVEMLAPFVARWKARAG